jgi:hypothetical protein
VKQDIHFSFCGKLDRLKRWDLSYKRKIDTQAVAHVSIPLSYQTVEGDVQTDTPSIDRKTAIWIYSLAPSPSEKTALSS